MDNNEKVMTVEQFEKEYPELAAFAEDCFDAGEHVGACRAFFSVAVGAAGMLLLQTVSKYIKDRKKRT